MTVPLDPTRLYLDVLKRVLTDTLFDEEMDHEDPDKARFIREFTDRYMRGHATTMLPMIRLDHLEDVVATIVREKIPGDFIEAGVWRGGACIFMRALLAVHEDTNRRVWVADSFSGLPEPDKEKYPREGIAHESQTMTEDYDFMAATADQVRANFERFGLNDSQVVFLEGWFNERLPTAPIETLSLLRLDGVYYDSTMPVLESLYPKVAPGGFIIIDDYGEDMWSYCSHAVKDYRRQHNIEEEITAVDSKCVWWRKSM